MARILFSMVPPWGHINPTIAIAQHLKKNGHTIAYTGHPNVAPVLKKTNLPLLENFKWGEHFFNLQKNLGTHQNRWLGILKASKLSPGKIFFEDLEKGVTDFIQLVKQWKPDIIVTDLMFYPGPIAAEVCGLPYATTCGIVFPLPSSVLAPYGSGISPKRKPNLKWKINAIIHHSLVRSGDRIVNKVRQKYNLAPIKESLFYPSPYLFLSFTTEAFEYKRPDLPKQIFFVGPSISLDRGDTNISFPWEWLDNRPLVYVSQGTMNTGKKRLFDTAIQASINQPWQIVISVGPYLNPNQWSNVPQNVFISNYVPQLKLLKKTSVMISHGGNNTTTEALANGIPLAVVAVGADRPETAQRVVEAGAGLRLSPAKITAKTLQKTIHLLLNKTSFRTNAQRIAKDYAKCNGPATASSLILKLIERKAPLHRQNHHSPTIYKNKINELLQEL